MKYSDESTSNENSLLTWMRGRRRKREGGREERGKVETASGEGGGSEKGKGGGKRGRG